MVGQEVNQVQRCKRSPELPSTRDVCQFCLQKQRNVARNKKLVHSWFWAQHIRWNMSFVIDISVLSNTSFSFRAKRRSMF